MNNDIKTKDVRPKGRKKSRSRLNGRQLTKKYREELAQRSWEQDRSENSATEQVEDSAVYAADKVTGELRQAIHDHRATQKEDRFRDKDTEPIRPSDPPSPQERMRQAAVEQRKEDHKRPRPGHSETGTAKQSVSANQSIHPSHQPKGAADTVPPAPGNTAAPGGKQAIKERTRPVNLLKERPKGAAATIKTRQNTGQAVKQSTKQPIKIYGGKNTKRSTTAVQRRAREAAQRKMLQKAKQSAKAAAELSKKAAIAVAKAVKALMGALAALVGGSTLLIALCVIILIAAIVASPLGILFSNETSTPGTVPLNAAVAQINGEYAAQLENLQAGGYDCITINGQPPDWKEVVAVFAAKTAGAEDGIDVATLDTQRVELLKAVFWDMSEITSETQTISHPDSDPEDGVDDSYTETLLTITITAKTADEMRQIYGFTEYQNEALDALLEELSALDGLLGDLSITQEDAVALLQNLPNDLSEERKTVIRHALTLVGKVNYFWGGKSLTLGWDSRWGQTMLVTSDGSSTTGTYRPFGLDCSGYVDWVFYNASDGAYVIGHGGGAASQHTYCTAITWAEALPGDLVFYPGDEHIGIVGGRDENGNLLILHCASGYNNVVITGVEGFASIGRPHYFSQ